MVEEKDLLEEFIFTVHCVNGEKIIHKYEVPPTQKEAEKTIKDIFDMVFDALAGEKPNMLFLNPNIHYNPKNVVGVEYGGTTKGQIEKMIKESQKHIGYKNVP